jgi:hypothetical protein
MVRQNLVSYILTALRKGQKLEEINKFLINAGYDKAEVESSVQYVINSQTRPELAEQQRIQQLSQYIAKQIKGGYQQQAVAKFLISRGYPYYEVNSALQQATLPKKETRFEHKLVVFALIAMFVMTAAVTVMYFKAYTLVGIGVPDKLLDVETEKLTTIVQQGGELAFQVKLINFGYEKRFDVLLEYKIIDRDTQGVVLEKSETLALSTTLENVVRFDMPDTMKTGKYVLRVDATYEDFTATSGFIFDVLSKELAEERIEEIREQVPEIPENVTDLPELAPDVVPDAVPGVPTPITKVPEDKEFYEGLTRTQAFALVKSTSVRDSRRAIEMCKSFELTVNQESCIMMLAKFKKSPAVCGEIESERGQDACYLQLLFELEQFDQCDLIKNAQIKQSCEMMKTTKQAEQLLKEGKEDEIKFLLQTEPVTTS